MEDIYGDVGRSPIFAEALRAARSKRYLGGTARATTLTRYLAGQL